MTVFTDDQATTPDNQNDKANVDDNQDYVELVVKEKGEQWKDPAALAKGYYHAQQRIKELEQKANKVDVEDFSKQLLEQLKAQTAQSPAPEPEPKGDSPEGNTTRTEDDIQSLIEETITKREREATVKQNIATVDKQLSETFGTEAKAVVQNKAKQLGLSMQRMQELAGESPSAFLALLGEAPKPQTNSVVTSETVVSSPSNKRNFAYFMKLKKENPRQFNTPAVQNMMLEERKRQGDAFYN